MEKLIIPIFAVFGFLGSLFVDGGSNDSTGKVTETSKAQIEYD